MANIQNNRIYVEPNADIPSEFATLVYTHLKAPSWGVLFHTIDDLTTPEFVEGEDGEEVVAFPISPLWVLKTADETQDGSEYYYRSNLFVCYVDNDFHLVSIDPEFEFDIFNTVDVEDLTSTNSSRAKPGKRRQDTTTR